LKSGCVGVFSGHPYFLQPDIQGGIRMKRWFLAFAAALSTAILLSPCSPQAAGPTASTPQKVAALSTETAQPQPGGIWKIIMKTRASLFGYPPRIVGPNRDFSPPFFNRLLAVGEGGKYIPELALSWNTSADGKAITFKLRKGVYFHDGMPFNAQAVKDNIDNLIPPKATVVPGITSVDVVDDYTVRLNLPFYNNLIFYHLALNLATYMYSPEALRKNGADWATTHPVGTGPFMLKEHQPNTSLTLVKNPNYWDKGLPYLDGIEIAMVPDPMTQVLTFKSGQVQAIYSAAETAAAQLRDEGYRLMTAPAGPVLMSFDVKNSEILSKRKVREAIEYAIDKEAICKGPGHGLFVPLYQILADTSPDYNPACPPRKYNPAKAKQLLAEAGYPNGFTFKVFMLNSVWKEGWEAAQNNLDAVGIKMDITFLNDPAFTVIRGTGKIEKGAASFHSYANSANALFMLDTFWRTTSNIFQYVVKPAGIDPLIDQAKSSRDPAAVTRTNRQILKLLYDDVTVVPLWQNIRLAVVDKSVQNSGWFMYGSEEISQFGTRTWLKK
jgi:peptide/nickel transport system substrate-binding protein